MDRDIDALNDEMKAAGVRIFVGGLHPALRASRRDQNRKLLSLRRFEPLKAGSA